MVVPQTSYALPTDVSNPTVVATAKMTSVEKKLLTGPFSLSGMQYDLSALIIFVATGSFFYAVHSVLRVFEAASVCCEDGDNVMWSIGCPPVARSRCQT